MVNEKQMLLDVLAQLKVAIESQDWTTAEKIDKQIKETIQNAVLQATTDEEKTVLIELLKRIQSLYQLLITNTEDSRTKISAELKKITSDKKAVNLYIKSSQY